MMSRARAVRAVSLLACVGLAGAASTTACGGGATTPSDDGGPAPSVSAVPSAPNPTTGDAMSATDATASSDAFSPHDATVDGANDATAYDATAYDAAAYDAASDGSADATADARDAAVNDDPFDPGSCAGPALTDAAALAKLGGTPRLKLADATLMRRSRACAGATPDTCGPWGAPVEHTQSLLTYSGGVVTAYKTFSFPTHLILYAQAGLPRFSVRHESDYRHTATTDGRGVTFAFGATPMVNTYPIIYVWDFAPAPNRYDDLQGLLGSRAELFAAERCARLAIANSVTTEIAALYKY